MKPYGGFMSIKNVPNLLSVLRLILVPLFVVLFLGGHTAAAIAVFLFAGATDVADGYLARKYNCISTLGKILDPLADKLLQLSAFVCLYIRAFIPLWMLLAYIAKEVFTVLGALVVFRKTKFVVVSNVFGKSATVLVFGAVFAIALFHDALGSVGITVICAIVAAYFVFSCVMYMTQEFLRRVRHDTKEEKDQNTPTQS